MYSLNVLHKINARVATAPTSESETSRHCSYAEQADGGVVLHSAKQRSTAYLGPIGGRRFLAEWFGSNSVVEHDALVERYFNSVPTGKQQLVS